MTLIRSAILRARGFSVISSRPRVLVPVGPIAPFPRGRGGPPRRTYWSGVPQRRRRGVRWVGAGGVRPPRPFASGARLLAHLVGLDHVLQLEVVERSEVDTALEALADLGDVVLEPAQTRDLDVLGHDRAVAQNPRPGPALDLAGPDDRTRDVAELAGPEDLAHLGAAELHLLVLRLEHPL